MGQRVFLNDITPIAAQFVLATAAFVMMALMPARVGTFLLVPLTGNAADIVAATAIAGNAALVARGPVPGSLIVAGERARLIRPLLAAHVLMIAAPGAGCGKTGLLK